MPQTSTLAAPRANDPLIIRLLQSTDAIDVTQLQQIYDSVAGEADPHTALVASGIVDPDQIATAYCEHYLMPRFDPPDESFSTVDASVADLLPADFCARHRIVPLADDGTTLDVAIDCPDGLRLADDIRFHTGRQMRAMFATAPVVTAGIVRLYGLEDFADGAPVAFEPKTKLQPAETSAGVCGGKPNEPLDWLLARVIQLRSDAVQLQRTGDTTRLRFRIDGHLTEVSPPHSMQQLIDQIDNATDWSRGGPASINHDSSCGKMQIRVHRCEIIDGQSWTLQFIRGPVQPPNLNELDIDAADRIDLIRGIDKPRGLTIVTGPSDSGKNETLYAALQSINDPTLNVFTVDQSVQYTLPGINQTIVDDTDHFGLHDHLQSVLCQSPDILLVHQVRDAATADLCVRVAEGGRRVLMTIPSADCVSALRHLESLGVSATRIGQTVRAVVAQRRMRRLCDHCKRKQDVSLEARRRLGIEPGCEIFQATGCDRCGGTGYEGRLTVYEIMRLNSRMSRQLSRYGSMKELDGSGDEGTDLRHRMMDKVLAGQTSLEELRKTF